MSRPRHKAEAGFTLIELLITLAISGVMLAAMMTFFLAQRQYLAAQEQTTEMIQNARAAMNLIVEDVRLAGYGAPKCLDPSPLPPLPPPCLAGYGIPTVPTMPLASWITWVTPALTSNPQIIKGLGSAPDAISIVGSVDAPEVPIAKLSQDVKAGDTSLPIVYRDDSDSIKFKLPTKILVHIGNENAVITGISGASLIPTLTISTNPTIAGKGLTGSYPKDTPVELVKVITYEIVIDTDKDTGQKYPVLKRNENTEGGRQPVTVNIEDLKITQNGNSIKITLTARTSKPDISYMHPTKRDHYRRITLSSEIQLRNL